MAEGSEEALSMGMAMQAQSHVRLYSRLVSMSALAPLAL